PGQPRRAEGARRAGLGRMAGITLSDREVRENARRAAVTNAASGRLARCPLRTRMVVLRPPSLVWHGSLGWHVGPGPTGAPSPGRRPRWLANLMPPVSNTRRDRGGLRRAVAVH